jgi:chromate reductase
VLQLVEKLRQADAFIIGTPEYNYSIPGTLKNAIDWFSRIHPQPFRAKPVGIVGASMGHLGTARAQYHLRQVFVYLDGRVMNVPEVMVGAAHTKFDSEGRLTDAATEEFLKKWLATFVAFCGR